MSQSKRQMHSSATSPRAPFGKVEARYDMDAKRKSWARPAAKAISKNADGSGDTDVVFQQVEVDQYYQFADPRFHPQGTTGEHPIIRMFGVTDEGNSLVVHVHGFQPYLYVEANHDQLANLPKFTTMLNAEIQKRDKGMGGQPVKCVSNIEVQKKKSFMNYQAGAAKPFLKVTLTCPHMVTKCKQIFQDMGQLTYESNVVFPLRFMVDHDIAGGQWIRIPKGSYQQRAASKEQSHCQMEFDVHHSKVLSHSPLEDDWGRIAPLRILSFDIECYAKVGFPTADKDPVITIASMITNQGESQPCIRQVLQLGSCDEIAGAEVLAFENESDMLRAWKDFLLATDPDLITGYNINNFDLPYLLDRATALRMDDFPFFGRIKANRTKCKATTFSSKAQGSRESKEISCDGRIIFDMFQAIQRDQKLSSYSLNAVCGEFLGTHSQLACAVAGCPCGLPCMCFQTTMGLKVRGRSAGDQKEDVAYSMIAPLQEGNSESRRRLATYCLKDAHLPQQLFDKLMYMYNYVEMARVTGAPPVPPSQLIVPIRRALRSKRVNHRMGKTQRERTAPRDPAQI